MKNGKWLLLCALLILLVLPAVAADKAIIIEGKTFDGSVYLPLRKTFEALDFDVSWDGNLRLIEVVKDDHILKFKPDQPYILHNDILVKAAHAPLIDCGHTYIDIAAVKQLFSSVKSLSATKYQLSADLVAVDHAAQKLANSAELEALLAFYPQQMRYGKLNGGGFIMEDSAMVPDAAKVYGAVPETTAAEIETAKSGDFSDTNNQVEGINESDIIKTDGEYIYALRDEELQIIKAGRNNLNVVASIKSKDFDPYQMFLYDDKLVLIGAGYSTEFKAIGNQNSLSIGRVYPNMMTFIDVYDIAAAARGKVERIKRISVDGDYLSGRRIDQYLYVVANQRNYGVLRYGGAKWREAGDRPLGDLALVDELMYFPGHVSNNMIYTIGIDLTNLQDDAIDINAYLGDARHLFVDAENLYIADVRSDWSNVDDYAENTDIYKYDIKNGKISYRGSGSVPGEVLNQFSMDSHKGYFRIATTTHWASDWSKTENHLFILDEDLEVVGKVGGLAPGERIYSTRMMGDKVFIVTYREVDPFFVIDAAVPTDPKVLGYLKIPGYSNYMHPYDKNTIIGVGRNTVEKEKGRIVDDGVKISLFDISDPQNPIEKDVVIVGDGAASSDVDYDHKAFLFDAEKNILALPISMSNHKGYSKDAYVFNFDAKGKLNLKGVISHSDMAATDKHYGDHNKAIYRILYIGDDLYTVSNKYIFLNDFNSLQKIEHLKR